MTHRDIRWEAWGVCYVVIVAAVCLGALIILDSRPCASYSRAKHCLSY
jgi:hypothetical protein